MFKTRFFLFSGIALAICVAHFWSTTSNVAPEPGGARSIYARYSAIARSGGQTDVALVDTGAEINFSTEWDKIVRERKEECSKYLQDQTKTCQASDNISDDSTLQHWKSYFLPTVIASVSYSQSDLKELNAISLNPAVKPSKNLVDTQDRSVLIFFNFLLFLKLVVWFLLCYSLRKLKAAQIFGAVFVAISGVIIFADEVLRRGAGVYAVDSLVTGSPTYIQEASKIEAIFTAIVGIAKVPILPAASASIFGIAPRGTAVFLALAVVVPIIFGNKWKFIWLMPIGLGVHFTTFLPLLALGLLISILQTKRIPRSEFIHLVGASLASLPILMIQLDKENFSFAAALISQVCVLVLCFIFISFSSQTSESEVGVRPGFLISSSIVIYALIGGWTIWKLSGRYGYSDTQGFWMDGLLRELAGRLAPLIQALGIVIPLICIVNQRYERSFTGRGLLSRHEQNDETLLYPALTFVVLFSAAILLSPYFLLN
jgi:hypothetical protein